MRPPDPAATALGLAFTVLASVGLWSAFAPLDWSVLGVALPLALIGAGVAGLAATRRK